MSTNQATNIQSQSLNVTNALQSQAFVDVRRRIFRQLVESLIYEGVVPYQVENGVFRINGQTEDGKSVTYLAVGKRMLTFNRIRLSEWPVLRQSEGMAAEAESLAQFLLEVRDGMGADEGRLAHFIYELEQTLFKDTLAQAYRREEGRSLQGLLYDELEGDVMDGHPYHPSYKSRIGFDFADNYAYGPEYKGEILPIWLAAHKSVTQLAVSNRLQYETFLRTELGEGQWNLFTEQVVQAGLNADDYLFLPVHPWQWQNQIASAFHDDLRTKRLLYLGTAQDSYRPQQSIRTMANHTSPEKAYIKLSMSIINTSTGRVLAPHTVQNAPVVSDWLKSLQADDPFLRDELRVILLGEVMGMSYDPPAPSQLVQSKTYGIAGCIWRESLHTFLEEEEEAVPFNSLTSIDLDGRPMIAPWVEANGAEAWLRHLFQVSILPLVHFLYKHGIAMETHAQNAVLVHKQGVPARLALKDFHDGIRFSVQKLGAPEKYPALFSTPEYHARVNANSFIETDDLDAVRDFMHDAFFFINLGELALLMAEHFAYDETQFWSLARQVIEEYQARFPELAERFELFDLFVPTIEVEQLTKRRLFPDTELRVHVVSNPLSLPVLATTGGRDA